MIHAVHSGKASRQWFCCLLISLTCLGLSSGCEVSVTAKPADPQTIKITDGLDREVTVPVAPQRIISLAPSVTEILFAIGADEQIVGVTSQCNYPPAAAKVDKVGGFTATSVSMETLVGMKPDLVISAGHHHDLLVEQIDKLGIPVVALVPESMADVCDDILLVGKVANRKMEAAEIVQGMKERMKQIEQRVDPLRMGPRATVFFQVWDEPLMTANRQTFIGEMIERLHGENIFAELDKPYPTVSQEVLLEKNPEIILAQDHSSNESELREKILRRDGWSNVAAIQTKRVYLIDDDLIVRSSPRLMDGYEQVARAMYPDHFPPTSEAGKTDAASDKQAP